MTLDYFKQRYGYEIEGMWMPRVTAVTSLVSGAPMMFRMREAADWGTLVHETIGSMLKGEEIQVDPRITPSLNAFSDWKRDYHMEIAKPQESIEKRVFDPENLYAGTVDLVCKVQGTLGILDLKTSTVIREEHALQTAAYFFAYNQGVSSSSQCKTRGIVRIDQYQECKGCFAKTRHKGRREVVSGGNPMCNHQWGEIKGEVEFKELQEHEEDLRAFLAAKELWEWYHRSWLKRISNYPKKVTQKILL